MEAYPAEFKSAIASEHSGSLGFLKPHFLYTSGFRGLAIFAVSLPQSFLPEFRVAMADYNKFDRRMESLVVETRTLFAPDITGLSPEDAQWISKAIHHNPELASSISYERAHTGFIREIVVTTADIARLYETQAR